MSLTKLMPGMGWRGFWRGLTRATGAGGANTPGDRWRKIQANPRMPPLMNELIIAPYVAVLALIFVVLSVRTLSLRRKLGAGAVSYTHLTLPTNREV